MESKEEKGKLLRVMDFQGQVDVPIWEHDGLPWIAGEDIGRCLAYKEPRVAVNKIYHRHKDELDALSVDVSLVSTDGKRYQTRAYSEQGAYVVAMHARTNRAKDVRLWLAGLPRALRDMADGIGAGYGVLKRLDEKLGEIAGGIRALHEAMVDTDPGTSQDEVDMGRALPTIFSVRPVSRSLMARDESVREFVELCCLLHPDASCRPGELHGAYQGWCQRKTLYPLGRNTFYRSLRYMADQVIMVPQAVVKEDGHYTYNRVAHGICLNRDGRHYVLAEKGGAS